MKKVIAILTTALFTLSAGSALANDKMSSNKMTSNKMTSNKMSSNKMMAKKDIPTTAIDAGMFKTLVMALKEAGLVETLKGKGPFTVFAPTDAAFAKVPKATLDALMKDKAKLKKVLLYHVVAGKVDAKSVMGMTSGKTVEGSDVKVMVKGKNVMINNAMVTKADIMTSNGIIHVIDKVLMP